jgi:hypothetical protein
VAGWEGGAAWANSTTMLTRANFALALLSNDNAALGKRCDLAKLAAKHGLSDRKKVTEFLVELLVQDAFDPTLRAQVEAKPDAKEVATLVLTSPEYQLA